MLPLHRYSTEIIFLNKLQYVDDFFSIAEYWIHWIKSRFQEIRFWKSGKGTDGLQSQYIQGTKVVKTRKEWEKIESVKKSSNANSSFF